MIKDNIKDKREQKLTCYRTMISTFMDRNDELPFASPGGRYVLPRSDTCLLPCRNVFRVNRTG